MQKKENKQIETGNNSNTHKLDHYDIKGVT